jgi:hypothetical protein
METVEIPAADLAACKKAMSLLDKLTGDKKDGLGIQRKLKEIDPSLNLPGIDVGDAVVAPIREELTSTRAQLDALIAERAKEKEAKEAKAVEKERKGQENLAKQYNSRTD